MAQWVANRGARFRPTRPVLDPLSLVRVAMLSGLCSDGRSVRDGRFMLIFCSYLEFLSPLLHMVEGRHTCRTGGTQLATYLTEVVMRMGIRLEMYRG